MDLPHDIWQYHKFRQFIELISCKSFSRKMLVSCDFCLEVILKSGWCGLMGDGITSQMISDAIWDPQSLCIWHKFMLVKSYCRHPFLLNLSKFTTLSVSKSSSFIFYCTFLNVLWVFVMMVLFFSHRNPILFPSKMFIFLLRPFLTSFMIHWKILLILLRFCFIRHY